MRLFSRHLIPLPVGASTCALNCAADILAPHRMIAVRLPERRVANGPRKAAQGAAAAGSSIKLA